MLGHLLTHTEYRSRIGALDPHLHPDLYYCRALNLQSLETQGGWGQNSEACELGLENITVLALLSSP